MNFIKRVLSTVVGIFVFCVISFLVFIFLIAIFGGSSDDDIIKVKDNSVLELTLDFEIEDYPGQFDYGEFAFLNKNQDYNGLFDIINAINYAATDDNIKGISIENNFISAGMSQTKAIRDALLNFKASGKFIKSYSDIYTQKDYYLNSVADEMYINPSGYLEFKGLYSERLYYKSFQEKTGFKMEVVRLGKYKSAVEPFLSDEMSAENREQISGFLNSIWSTVKAEISESRTIPVEQLNTIADDLLGRTAKMAVEAKLIDTIAYQDEYKSAIKSQMGLEDNEDIETISISDYAEFVASKRFTNRSENNIAVIFAEGQIVYGEGDENNVGQGYINASLKNAREDDKVKAVVLRINSPGGDALASELIWREIELTKAVKPVIVSMGDLAASGGYYIAAGADKIIAEPTTITGSIGVFGMLPNGKELSDNIGINAEQVVTNKNAVMYSFFEPLNDTQRGFIKEGINNIYELFTMRVADGRNMTQDAVKDIAQGRVWSGESAVKNGLVDELGGLDLALEKAAEAANIEDYKVKQLPIFEKDFEKVFKDLGLISSKEDLIKQEIGEENYRIFKNIKTLSEQKGVQLLFPYSLDIQ